MDKADWSLVPAFLAVAETGSLSAAARRLGQSQPTLGRHVATLEAAAGQALFRRHARGLELTRAGAALLPAARAVAEAAAGFSLAAAGNEVSLAGSVRITASAFVAHYLLPPVIAAIRVAEPEIQIDLVPSDASENLLFREADIALRMYRPEQLDVITRHIGDIPMGLFASTGYLAARGTPRTPGDLLQHDLVGYDRDERIILGLRRLGHPADRSSFAVRCDGQTVYWELVRAGCGIGAGQVPVGRADPGVARVLPEVPIDPLPVWLTAHEALRSTPRIRRVWDLLQQGLRPVLS